MSRRAIAGSSLALLALGCGRGEQGGTSAAGKVATNDPVPATWRAERHVTEATADSGMVVSASPRATLAGVEVLMSGGNAIDAAVATAFALAVTYPTAGNLGGGGFIVARMGDSSYALDFREVAPGKATRDMYLDAKGDVTDKSITGPLAAGVPGSVAGLWEAHHRLGRKPWKDVLRPAIELAENGFAADSAFIEDLDYEKDHLTRFPASAALYYPNGEAVKMGAVWRNPDLAATLKRIAERGADGFYKGETAKLVEAEMKRSGGIMTAADLANYRAKWRAPVEFTYRGHRVVSMPPASSGGLTVQLMANILGGYDLGSMGFHSPQAIHLIAAAEREAFARRNTVLADPEFVQYSTLPFTSPDTAAALRALIDGGGAAKTSAVSPVNGTQVLALATPGGQAPRKHTTHLSVVDKDGNAVALTTTLNGGYGSAVTVTGAGFLLNNEMDDFTTKVGVINAMGLRQGEANAIVPGKRMLSSMTPTIVLDSAGRPLLVTGASGGARIITAVAQVLFNVLDFRLPLGDAMVNPRFHAQDFPDSLLLERGGYDAALVSAVQAKGHHPSDTPAWGYDFGWAQTILRVGARWVGVSEPRAHGQARGY